MFNRLFVGLNFDFAQSDSLFVCLFVCLFVGLSGVEASTLLSLRTVAEPKSLALMGAASFCVRDSGRKRYSGQQEKASKN
ncbi:hypothetical protein B0A71_16165 [Flavobacterium tructae]|uniref:PEP-CTERM sorting domain-containing protein n=1 Tax=Flavobacterium tructae TaxID=1114873 RepID=A0ABX4D3W6_9FLAO|nr:hypothetical protein B0A71_16165 [Flavobacterium tructae]